MLNSAAICFRSVLISFAGMACTDNNVNATLHCKISASKIPNRNTCSGQLLFEDDFDVFDLERWHHEVSASGGRVVPVFICVLFVYSCVLLFETFEDFGSFVAIN